jgi:hypothetical protein
MIISIHERIEPFMPIYHSLIILFIYLFLLLILS